MKMKMYILLVKRTIIFVLAVIAFCDCKVLSESQNLKLSNESPSDATGDVSCDTVRRKYRRSGYSEDDIYTMQQFDTSLKICGKSRTCCKNVAENNLVSLSDQKRRNFIIPIEKELKSSFQNSTNKFKVHFRSLITESQARLDAMFAKTYGTRYVNNTAVFQALYTALHRHLNGSELNLQSALNDFFSALFKKVYVMSKPWIEFPHSYQTCIHDSTVAVQPFGDMSRKIIVQTLRSFFASRVFLQGLRVGMNTAQKLLSVPMTDACTRSYTRMTECAVCASNSIEEPPPCHSYCRNVMKGCFVYLMMIQPKWNAYITDMRLLADKLQGPFSMEAIIGPLGVKISEAIMVFQDNSRNITAKVQERCGAHPVSNLKAMDDGGGRRRRRGVTQFGSFGKKYLDGLKMTAEQEANLPFLANFNNGHKPKQETAADRLVASVKLSLEGMMNNWMALAERVCESGLSTKIGVNHDCWNGDNTTGYTRPVVGDEMKSLFNRNPEVRVNSQLPNRQILAVANELQDIRDRIKSALEGNENMEVDVSPGSGEQPATESPVTTVTSAMATTTMSNEVIESGDNEISGDTEESSGDDRNKPDCGSGGEDTEGSAGGNCDDTESSGDTTGSPDRGGFPLPTTDMPNEVEVIGTPRAPSDDNNGNENEIDARNQAYLNTLQARDQGGSDEPTASDGACVRSNTAAVALLSVVCALNRFLRW